MLNIQLKRIPERETTWKCAGKILEKIAEAKHRVGECESLETDTAFHRLNRTADAMKPYVSLKAGTTPDPMTLPDTPAPPPKLSMTVVESKSDLKKPTPHRPEDSTSVLASVLGYFSPGKFDQACPS